MTAAAENSRLMLISGKNRTGEMDKRPVTLKEKPVIGISACGFNAPVRYNGRSMDFIKAIGREKGDFRWCLVCPETAAGLGVPLDPIHLSGAGGRSI